MVSKAKFNSILSFSCTMSVSFLCFKVSYDFMQDGFVFCIIIVSCESGGIQTEHINCTAG